MKIIKLSFITLLVALMCLPGLVAAEFKGGSGEGSVTTVQEFKNQCALKSSGGSLSGLIDAGVDAAKCDDRNFTLEGNIVSQIENNVFEFKDGSGTIYVEINDWGGVDAGPKDLVRLYGEADYEESGLMLEVDRVELIK